MKRTLTFQVVIIALAMVAISCTKASPQKPVVIVTSAPPEPVDLGLSVKWASHNLGAARPEGCGELYRWAGKSDISRLRGSFDWNDCPCHSGIDRYSNWTKYIPSDKPTFWYKYNPEFHTGSPDNKLTLDLDDDVAHSKLGGTWRIPTKAEFIELIDNCTSEWVLSSAVPGLKLTSKKNGNSIFLPAAGLRDEFKMEFLYKYGCYWTSSLYADFPYSANYLSIGEKSKGIATADRYYGLSVRPVSED